MINVLLPKNPNSSLLILKIANTTIRLDPKGVVDVIASLEAGVSKMKNRPKVCPCCGSGAVVSLPYYEETPSHKSKRVRIGCTSCALELIDHPEVALLSWNRRPDESTP